MHRFLPLIFALAACDHRTSDAPPTASTSSEAAPAALDALRPPPTTRLRITNRCAQPIWIAHSDNVPAAQNVELAHGASHAYAIPAAGVASVRFWPKTGCDASGHACAIGV